VRESVRAFIYRGKQGFERVVSGRVFVVGTIQRRVGRLS
jgi:hypothetical protein